MTKYIPLKLGNILTGDIPQVMIPNFQTIINNKKESYLWLLQKKGLFSSSSALAKLFANLWTDDVCKKISVHHFVRIGCCCLLTSPLPKSNRKWIFFCFCCLKLIIFKKLNSSANIVLIYAHRKLTDVAKISSNNISFFFLIKKVTWQMQKMSANLVLNSIKKNGKSISMC